jgi:hypothetical protein
MKRKLTIIKDVLGSLLLLTLMITLIVIMLQPNEVEYKPTGTLITIITANNVVIAQDYDTVYTDSTNRLHLIISDITDIIAYQTKLVKDTIQ